MPKPPSLGIRPLLLRQVQCYQCGRYPSTGRDPWSLRPILKAQLVSWGMTNSSLTSSPRSPKRILIVLVNGTRVLVPSLSLPTPSLGLSTRGYFATPCSIACILGVVPRFVIYFRHLRAMSINSPASHPSCHGSIALPMPEVPKMSPGAIRLTSSGSNGCCWVVLVIQLLSWEKKAGYIEKKSVCGLHQQQSTLYPLTFFHTRVTAKQKYTGYTFFHTWVTSSTGWGGGCHEGYIGRGYLAPRIVLLTGCKRGPFHQKM